MQNRYVGDVGDFAKYALLRRLIGRSCEHEISLGVVWCLFPNETHNNDGRHVAYLQKPDFEALDDPLLAALRHIVVTDNRCVSAVSGGRIFRDGTVYFNEPTAAPFPPRYSPRDRLRYRKEWLARCFNMMETRDLVFFDPDNGVEVASVPKHHPNAGKYIYWDELLPFWNRGQALLVYHHLNRSAPAAQQVSDLRDRFRAELDGASVLPLVFRRGSCRVFWLVYPISTLGAELERRARDFLSSRWSRHFAFANTPEESRVVTLSMF